MGAISESAAVVITFWNILIIPTIFLLPEVKDSFIISNKNSVLMLPPKLLKECFMFVGLL